MDTGNIFTNKDLCCWV